MRAINAKGGGYIAQIDQEGCNPCSQSPEVPVAPTAKQIGTMASKKVKKNSQMY